MENIKQIKIAEAEAEKITTKARKETEEKITAAKANLGKIYDLVCKHLEPKLEKIKKETGEAIKEYEKMAEEEQKIILENLEEIDDKRINKAVRLITEKMDLIFEKNK